MHCKLKINSKKIQITKKPTLFYESILVIFAFLTKKEEERVGGIIEIDQMTNKVHISVNIKKKGYLTFYINVYNLFCVH